RSMVRAKARMALSGSSFMVSIIDRWSRLGDRANAPHSVRCSSHQRRHPMNVLLGVSGLIFVSAVTPGPNNIAVLRIAGEQGLRATAAAILGVVLGSLAILLDRKSTRLNSSHVAISYAVFCLKKK